MAQEITSYSEHSDLGKASQTADDIARAHVLQDYLLVIGNETRRRQLADITLFEAYLQEVGVSVIGMADDLSLWSDVSHGLIKGFQRWQLRKGYAIGSVNVRLATMKAYCRLATDAGHLPSEKYTLIQTVRGLRGIEGRNIDERRETRRMSTKKEKSPGLTRPFVERMKESLYRKAQDGDVTAIRDYFLLCLLADHGLRCGEVAGLHVENVNITTGMLVFYRRKVDKTQTHRLTPDTLTAARLYLKSFILTGYLFPGQKPGTGLTTRAINARVGVMGKHIDIASLSPHDLRHYWATNSLTYGTDIGALQQAGGWSNPYMPLRYREDSRIANEGVKQS